MLTVKLFKSSGMIWNHKLYCIYKVYIRVEHSQQILLVEKRYIKKIFVNMYITIKWIFVKQLLFELKNYNTNLFNFFITLLYFTTEQTALAFQIKTKYFSIILFKSRKENFDNLCLGWLYWQNLNLKKIYLIFWNLEGHFFNLWKITMTLKLTVCYTKQKH